MTRIDYATISPSRGQCECKFGSYDSCGPGTMDIGVTYTEFFFQCEGDSQFQSE